MNKEEAKVILEDIFSDLGSNEEDNLDLLAQKKEKYKDHPRYGNIVDKILIKEKEYLNKENKEAYESMMNKYIDSINYGISLANDFFDKGKIDESRKVLETLIKSFSGSYINDEFGNCVYFNNEFEENLYRLMHEDYRELIISKLNKGYVYYMYGRILLEVNLVDKAILAFDLAQTYSPFLKEAYFFKALLLKVNKRFVEAKEDLLKAHKYIYKDIDLADFYYFVGNYCYKFINKEYEFVMYQKSYSLNPNKELLDELTELKPVDKDIELDENFFNKLCKEENIPIEYDKLLEVNKEKLLEENDEYRKYL